MKIFNRIVSLLILCSVISLYGCANTGEGMHEDWKQNTQKIANATND